MFLRCIFKKIKNINAEGLSIGSSGLMYIYKNNIHKYHFVAKELLNLNYITLGLTLKLP